jgi:hypothetical protein
MKNDLKGSLFWLDFKALTKGARGCIFMAEFIKIAT